MGVHFFDVVFEYFGSVEKLTIIGDGFAEFGKIVFVLLEWAVG